MNFRKILANIRYKYFERSKVYLAKGGTITKVPSGCGRKVAVDFVTRKKQEINV